MWRLPLCSSSAVLRDGDVLTVSRSLGPEPQLQVSPGPRLLWLLTDISKAREKQSLSTSLMPELLYILQPHSV